jgi:predicted ATPase
MLVGISGSQGQGKTTVLNTLSELGYNVSPRKTSRTILRDWGYTLDEVNKYPPLTQKFQEEVLVRHRNSELPLIEDKSTIHFAERTYADIFAYTMFAMGSFNEYNKWLSDYHDRCLAYQQDYDIIIHLGGRDYTPELDGVRSINKQFMLCVNLVIDHFLEEFNKKASKSVLIKINTPDHNERIDKINEAIRATFGEQYVKPRK